MNSPIGPSVADVTKASGIGRTKVFEMIRDGKLPARKIGARTIVLSDDLKRFLESLPASFTR